jgi:hypothetical protein
MDADTKQDMLLQFCSGIATVITQEMLETGKAPQVKFSFSAITW